MTIKGQEQAIQDSIRVALAEHGYIVFRTNVGKVKTADGRWFDSGLPTGFPDLMGFEPENGKIYWWCGIKPSHWNWSQDWNGPRAWLCDQ